MRQVLHWVICVQMENVQGMLPCKFFVTKWWIGSQVSDLSSCKCQWAALIVYRLNRNMEFSELWSMGKIYS